MPKESRAAASAARVGTQVVLAEVELGPEKLVALSRWRCAKRAPRQAWRQARKETKSLHSHDLRLAGVAADFVHAKLNSCTLQKLQFLVNLDVHGEALRVLILTVFVYVPWRMARSRGRAADLPAQPRPTVGNVYLYTDLC